MQSEDLDDFISLLRGVDIEEGLRRLRSAGLSKVQCIVVLAESAGLGLASAKQYVHDSKAWRDCRDRDERFHDWVEETICGNPMPGESPDDARSRES